MSNNTRESFPPETATQTCSLFLIILYSEIVLAALRKIELEKHSDHRVSPEYILE